MHSIMNINYIITKDKFKSYLARYLYATAFSPHLSTCIKAIKMRTLLLGLGHFDQESSNLQSTKLQEEDEYFFLLK